MKKTVRYLTFLTAAAITLLLPIMLGKLDARFSTSGVEGAKAFPDITVNYILSGQAQTDLEQYIQQNFPGKPLMARPRNQLTFSLLATTPNNNYNMSMDRNLFTWGNVSAYMQYNEPITEDFVRDLMPKIEKVEALAAESDIQAFAYITPCKVRYYEEELPWVDKVIAPERTGGSYECPMEALRTTDLNYFDSIDYIGTHCQEFDARVPLYYRIGVHWSTYVGNLAGTALGDYIEEKSGYNLPELSIMAHPCEEPVYPDSDVFNILNLLQKPYNQYYEPVIEVIDSATDAPGMLCRGGSFMGQSLSTIIRDNYFGKNVYMENDQIFTDAFGNLEIFHDHNDAGMKAYFQNIDILILEVNEPLIPSMNFGFIGYVLEYPKVLRQEE